MVFPQNIDLRERYFAKYIIFTKLQISHEKTFWRAHESTLHVGLRQNYMKIYIKVSMLHIMGMKTGLSDESKAVIQ